MKTYDFEVILAAGTDMTEELADRLFLRPSSLTVSIRF